MTTKQRKHLASIVGICSILTILGGCQKETQITEPMNETTNTTNTTKVGNTNETIVNDTAIPAQKLVIHPGCVGCGRCAMFAPNNFVMNGRQAQVISQDNINAPEVQYAIKNCKTQVIEIVEV